LLLLERYNTWVPVYDIGSLGGSEPNTFYARVSLQVYNDESDVRFLADAISDIVKQHERK
jgi:selenocysteine lyase/cysteine desulfurase